MDFLLPVIYLICLLILDLIAFCLGYFKSHKLEKQLFKLRINEILQGHEKKQSKGVKKNEINNFVK